MQRRGPIVSRTTPSSLSQGSPYVVIRDAAPPLSQHCGSDGLSAARVESGSRGVGDHAASRSRSGRTAAAPRREPDRCTARALHKSRQLAGAQSGSSQLVSEAKQQWRLTAPRLLRLRSPGCQQAPAVTPALRWTAQSSSQSRPPSVVAWPRTQPSCRRRADDCIARMMRKPNHARLTAAVALLLLIGRDTPGWPRLRWSRRLRDRDCRRPPNCVLPTTGGC